MNTLKSVTATMACIATLVVADTRDSRADTNTAFGLSLGATIGTLGVGAQATLGVTSRLNVRGAANWADFGFDIDAGDTTYDVDVEMLSVMALADWHPFGTGFRATVGASFSDSTVGVAASFSDWQTIGDQRYPPELIGRIEGTVAPEQVAPYIGIGYGNAVGPGTTWSFVFDLGVLIQSYSVELSATGPAAAYPPFQNDLEQERRELQDEFDKLRVYPVLAIGIARRL